MYYITHKALYADEIVFEVLNYLIRFSLAYNFYLLKCVQEEDRNFKVVIDSITNTEKNGVTNYV